MVAKHAARWKRAATHIQSMVAKHVARCNRASTHIHSMVTQYVVVRKYAHKPYRFA